MKTLQLNTVFTGRRYLYLALVVILITSVIGSTISPQGVKAQEISFTNNVYLPIIMKSLETNEEGLNITASCTGNCSCTDYAKAKRADLNFISANAKDWGTVASQNGFPVNSTPRIQDIVVFQPGVYGAHLTYGHVAYVESVGTGNTFSISEKGYCSGTWTDLCAIHYRYNLTVISGVSFIHKKDSCPISPGQGAGNRSFLYQQAYDRNGGVGTLGCMSNEVHDWGYGMYLQDFPGVGVYGNGAIVHDQGHDNPYGTIYAYVVHGDLWDKYTQDSNAVAMGPPTSDQYTSPLGRTQQSFFHGYINWNGTLWKLNYWPSSGTGFRLEYRNARNFTSGPTYVVYKAIPADPNKKLDINWTSGAPGTGKYGVWADNFSLKATTTATFQQGKYVFWVQADDGVRLYVNNQLIIDEWHESSNGNYYTYYTFPSQKTYSVRLEYYDQSGNAYVNLDWWKY